MTKYQFIQRLQNSPLTSWLWRYWQQEDTGYVIMLVFWKNPGKRWYEILKEQRWKL
jgi:hypothetical protein